MKRIALLSPNRVLAILRSADRHGKHGRAEDASWYSVGAQPYVLFDAPIAKLDHEYYDPETGEFNGMSAHQERRVERYARMRGTPPPIRLSYRSQRAGGKAFIADGNHRTEVAKRAGRKTIRAMMPLNEFRVWSSTMQNPFNRRVSGKRSAQAKSTRPSKRTRYKSSYRSPETTMAKRRRRNVPITKSQARALRAILAAHGYRVKRKKRKARRAKKSRRSNPRGVWRAKAPKRLHSGTVFKRKGRRFVVVSYVVRRGGKKVRVRFARQVRR